MVKAAVSGAVDYSQADPLDEHWWLRFWWAIEEVQRQEAIAVLETHHRHEVALLAHGRLADDGFSKTQDRSNELVEDITKLHRPWYRKQTMQERAGQLRQMWVDRFGDPDSDEVKAGIAKLQAYFESVRRMNSGK